MKPKVEQYGSGEFVLDFKDFNPVQRQEIIELKCSGLVGSETASATRGNGRNTNRLTPKDAKELYTNSACLNLR